tara:strand:- start:240 stop:872 length:633 start_codon:yes stop_codon:yes gene_type:complete
MNHLKSFNGLRALSRNFVTLDPVLNSQYELAQPITFTGDFEIEVEFNKGDQTTTFNVLTGFSTNHHWIATHINNKVSVSVGGTMFSGVIPVFDGKHHLVKLTRVGELVSLYVDGVLDGNTTKLGDIVFDQIGRNGSGHLFDGIISNVKFTDKSGASDVVTTFKLDNSPAANDYTYSTEILNNNTFTDNANARHYLIAKKGWIISDGGAAP